MTSLRSRLVVLLAVPLLVLVVATTLGLASASRAAAQARASAREVDLSLAVSNAALQLSRERHLSATALAAPQQTRVPDELSFQRGKTSEAVATLESLAGSRARLEDLGRLDSARRAVDERSHAEERGRPDQVLDVYTDLVGPVRRLDRRPQHVDDARQLRQLTAHHALAKAIHELAQQQSLVAAVFSRAQMDTTTYERLLGLRAGEVLWLEQFEDNASSEQLQRYHDASNVPATTTAQRLRQNAVAAGPAGTVAGGDVEVWSSAMGRRIDLLEALANDMATDLGAVAEAQQAAAGRRQLLAGGFLIGTLLLAAGLATLLHRGVLRPLHWLSWTTRRQAAGGAQTEAMLLNFGRRTQNLVGRQLGHIDGLEARTDDPDTLDDLFVLDHLATRLRRNAESVVVLAGAESPRRWSRPVTIVNVVRAAAAEAADYSRVDVGAMVPASVVGATANDISHLLAELIDHALNFSPTDCRVTIAGEPRPDGGYLVTVTDDGPGLSPHQLKVVNNLLARDPASDAELSHYFGFFVVSRFAQRNGVDVELEPSEPRGTTARVRLPATVIAPPAMLPAEAASHALAAPLPRPPMPAPNGSPSAVSP